MWLSKYPNDYDSIVLGILIGATITVMVFYMFGCTSIKYDRMYMYNDESGKRPVVGVRFNVN